MIFGFNTDVPLKGVVYHVQTEDRGEKHPIIDSIIYVSGRIVDRRRTSYVPAEVTPEQVKEMVRNQHKDLVEGIRSGTYVPPREPQLTGNSPSPAYSIELANASDLYLDGRLCFEVAVRENGKSVVPSDVSLDLRWLVAGVVAESRPVALEGDGRAVIVFPLPEPPTEAALLVRAKGPAGEGFSKFLARPASS